MPHLQSSISQAPVTSFAAVDITGSGHLVFRRYYLSSRFVHTADEHNTEHHCVALSGSRICNSCFSRQRVTGAVRFVHLHFTPFKKPIDVKTSSLFML
ncbi:hypothetical protein V6N13_148703 [Hibiscus sabdariffa]|uniref:Uncharacterized protein n=1 Tax=Hibiscus sabdariffa TaxID=183260 RepID=A0ABR2EJM5_9ROSI